MFRMKSPELFETQAPVRCVTVGPIVDSPSTTPASGQGRSSELRALAQVYLVRAAWALVSFIVATLSGVLSGLRVLDHMTGAPLLRSTVFLISLGGLAAVSYGVSHTVEKTLNNRESTTGTLLRKKVAGPRARWAIWIATLSAACTASYLLNDHRPAEPTLAALLPAHLLDVVVVALGASLVTPCILALAKRGKRQPPLWPRAGWNRPVRDDDDIVGAISRMSPPLLAAMFLAVAMFIAIYVVGLHEPKKLLAGFGVLGLFLAGLFAAPSLLRVQDIAIEPQWRLHVFDMQRRIAARVRRFAAHAHRTLVTIQVIWLGLGLGVVTSGNFRVKPPAWLAPLGVIAGGVGFMLARILWQWDPHPEEQEPISTDALASRESQLLRFAGWALIVGSVCSLVAVLSD